ncbi:MAG: cation:proton antiporter [Desulfobulbales bacterium]|nr:cation:proton antiporter [Desulfobulbales bacterium]
MSHLSFSSLFALGLILVVGYFAGRLAAFFRIPQISGYIVAGLLFSPSISGIFPAEQIDTLFTFTSEAALAVIAYAIGGSLQISMVRVLGRSIWWTNLTQGFGAFLCTTLAIYGGGRFLLPMAENSEALGAAALVMGGIAVATAPAATIAVVHELRAKGPLTTTLLGVVALDDALSIIVFSIALAIAGRLQGIDPAAVAQLSDGVIGVGGALLTGVLGGFLFSLFLDPAKRADSNLMLSLGAIFLIGGISTSFGFSPLLANMAMGFVVVNRVERADTLFHQLDLIEKTLFCLFFVLAAAHFDISVFRSSALLGTTLLVVRLIGKMAGAYLGGKFSGAPEVVTRYLGITLLPQAGLSLGLIFLAKPMFPPATFDLLLSAMLASIILNEIISPPLVRWALTRADETNADR